MFLFNAGSIMLSENEMIEIEFLKKIHQKGATILAGPSAYGVDEKGKLKYICEIGGITKRLIYDIYSVKGKECSIDLTQLIRDFSTELYIPNTKKSLHEIVQELMQLGGKTLYVQVTPLKLSVQFESGSCSNLSKEESHLLYEALKENVLKGKTIFNLQQILQMLVLQQLTAKHNTIC